MPIEFYASRRLHVIGPIHMLPQKGSVSGGSKRPLNSWAVLREGYSVLFDAPFSWVMDGVQGLADDGHPPLAYVLSHRDLAASGDAFDALASEFGASILLHPDDQTTDKAKAAGVSWGDPTSGQGAEILRDAGLELIHVPGHSPGSIMLYLPGPSSSKTLPLRRSLPSTNNDAESVPSTRSPIICGGAVRRKCANSCEPPTSNSL